MTNSGGAPVILGEVGAGNRSLLICNHYDVQPPDPLEEWVSPPFEPTVRAGALYARGVADNKGNLVAPLCVARAYREVFGRLPMRLVFVLEGEDQLCQAYGIPAVSLDVGWSGSHVHAPNENVRVADFIQGIKVMGRACGVLAAS